MASFHCAFWDLHETPQCAHSELFGEKTFFYTKHSLVDSQPLIQVSVPDFVIQFQSNSKMGVLLFVPEQLNWNHLEQILHYSSSCDISSEFLIAFCYKNFVGSNDSA